jgi:hypothetical protein
VLYVDDLVIAGNSMQMMNKFQRDIASRFDMKDLGELKWILGMEVRRDRKKRTIEIVQTAYFDQMLKRFGMEDCKPASVPMVDSNLPKLSIEDGAGPSGMYQSMVGSLLYAVIMTRPDLAFPVQTLGRHMQASDERHINAAKQVLRYLKQTRELGIMLGATDDGRMDLTCNAGDTSIKLEGYSDSDWGRDKVTRRSTTGYLFFAGRGPVAFKSKLQQRVAGSSSEAEYVAASMATQEAIHLRQLLADLNQKQEGPTMIYEDNQGAIALSENPVHHQRTKHIDIRYHFVRERVESNEVKLVYVPTEDQLADLLTKPLSKHRVIKLRERVLGYKAS